MKTTIFLSLLSFLISNGLNAQFSQKQFIIGAYQLPVLGQESATLAPAHYSGNIWVDLGQRINSGVNAGKFEIDYYNPSVWFQQYGWSIITSSAIYGTVNDKVVCADYDGDGYSDIAVFKLLSKTWNIDYAANNFGSWDATYSYSSFGDIDNSVIPVPADYDGDGKADIGFHTSNGKWIIDYSNNGFGNSTLDFANSGYGDFTVFPIPVPGDYDGDGKADISIKVGSGEWKIDLSGNGYNGWDVIKTNCGDDSWIPVNAQDYNNDGKADIAVKTNSGSWKVSFSNLTSGIISWNINVADGTYGLTNVLPIAADFNGDDYADFGFIFPNGSFWIDNYHAQTAGYEFISEPGKIGDNYNKNSLNSTDLNNYTKFAGCYFNLDVTGMANLSSYNQDDYYLTLLDNVGLNGMLTNGSLYGMPEINTTAFDKNSFVDHFNNQISSNLKNRIYSINLGDEPIGEKLNHIGDWSSFFSQNYPEKPTFNNLLPRYYHFVDDADFLNYLETYKSLSNSPFVCFDHYPFRTTSFVRSYFYNLLQIKNEFPDRALWSVVYSAFNNNTIPNPNEKQLRFMAFCPIAYGARGIIYYPYDNGTGYSLAINNDSTKYDNVQNINLFLRNIVGPITIGSKNIATLHKADTYTNYVTASQNGYQFTASELLSNYTGLVKDVNNSNVLLGIFAKNDTTTDPKVLSVGNYYIWVVNKDTGNAITNLLVTLRGNYLGNIKISPRAFNYINNPITSYTSALNIAYDSSSNTTNFTIPSLESGEGIMVKVFSNNNIPAPADYDGDKITDISVKENDGTWLIDYSSNGFGNWDWWGTGYGDQTFHPVPADYDGDGKADLSLKNDAGDWKIDYWANGVGSWDFNSVGAYGNSQAHPVPADYDGDGKVDLSVKTDYGSWLINYAAPSPGFSSGWDIGVTGYGDQTFHPVPADYDGDGKADLCVKSDAGDLKIDYWANGLGSWDINSVGAYGNSQAHPVPADYDGDGKVDLSVKTDYGSWLINYAAPSPGFYSGWDIGVTGYGDQTALALPSDYGGDGKADLGVKYTNGDWKIDYSYNGFGSFDSIQLTPKVNDPIYSERVIIKPTAAKDSTDKVSLEQFKQYEIKAIFDVSGRLVKNINKMTTIFNLRNTLYLPSGIYFVQMLINSRIHIEKIYLGR